MGRQREVCLVAGGYSVREGIDKGLWDKIKDKEIWSLNFAYKFMPLIPTRELWVDITFFRNYREELEKLSKLGVPMFAKSHLEYTNINIIKQYDVYKNKAEVDKFPNNLFDGQMGLVGFFALSLAIREGYDTIYLMGYDFGSPNIHDRNTHWYSGMSPKPEFPKEVISNGLGNTQIYLQTDVIPNPMITDFDFYLRYPNKIINVSSRTNVTYFPIISYDDFFRMTEEKDESIQG